MKLTKCNNGHFYDAEKFSTCPHCSEQGSVGGSGISETIGLNIGGQQPINKSAASVGEDDVTTPLMMGGSSASRQAAPKPVQNSEPDEGKTVGYFNWNNSNGSAAASKAEPFEERPTEPLNLTPKMSAEPIVGWLVCIEGPSKGRSYNVYCGKNYIGRSNEMDICLAEDKTVSRSRHATVIYEPKARIFFATSGDSHELFYLNDQVVLSNVQLNDRDVLTIGKTSLVFVPFCDQRYGWE